MLQRAAFVRNVRHARRANDGKRPGLGPLGLVAVAGSVNNLSTSERRRLGAEHCGKSAAEQVTCETKMAKQNKCRKHEDCHIIFRPYIRKKDGTLVFPKNGKVFPICVSDNGEERDEGQQEE